MNIMDFLYPASLITFVLILLYKTNVFVEYGTLFKIDKLLPFLHFDLFKSELVNNPLNTNNYIEFITGKYYDKSFLARLFSCVLCFNFWLTLVVSTLCYGTNFYIFAPIIYILSLLVYFQIK